MFIFFFATALNFKSYLWPCCMHISTQNTAWRQHGSLILNFHKKMHHGSVMILSLPTKRSNKGQGGGWFGSLITKIVHCIHHYFWTGVLHTYLKFITAWRQHGSWSLKFRGKCHQGASMPLRNCLRHTKCCCNFACARLAHENVNNGY